MDFETKKIRRFSKQQYQIFGSIFISILVIVLLLAGIAKAVSRIDFSVFLTIAGESLETDNFGHTNFLLLGKGGENHDGGNLYDTIIVASLDHENKLVSMLSIPRDLYIKDSEVGSSKINEVAYNGTLHYGSEMQGLDHMKSKVEELVGIPIHYWVSIDFQGFKDIIDALGGIQIDVREAIYDPYYPKDGTDLYQTFSLSAGPQLMDGETALKYARSRKTTSDFHRADRQQEILYAIKDKALETKTILDKSRIENLLSAIGDNIETNITVKEILTAGVFAKDFDSNNIIHRLIHDDPNQCGGFLYTPDRSFYNGQFVLIPAGDVSYIQRYADLNFNTPEIAHANTRIHILNGTATGGVAAETKQILRRYCFDVIRFGNGRSQDIQTTTYYYKQKVNEKGKPIDSRPIALDFLERIIPGQESTEIPAEYQEYINETDLIIEIGSDYVNSDQYIEDPFYYLIPVINAANEANQKAAEGGSSTETSTETEAPAAPESN